MKVLLVGAGGREHALAWMIAQSDLCDELFCAPGNAGTSECAELVAIKPEDVEALTAFAKDKNIDLVVVGPEAPLVMGLADRLEKENIKVFGPSAQAARLEGSKAFTKDLCAKYGIPSGAYGRFTDLEKAKEFINEYGAPIVVKADGLAAGKGVIIAETEEEALEAATDMLAGEAFGEAGHEIVIEEFLDGEELSYFALSDGDTILPFISAQDHKRVGEGDTGPNTGGMGAYSPAKLMGPELERKIIHEIIEPTVEAMKSEGCPFKGVLYAGIMVVKGQPLLLEYNARFGDPECQPLMMRLEGDLLEILNAAAEGKLEEVKGKVSWSADPTICVVLASEGYPGEYKKGTVIRGIDKADQIERVKVFHAGTAKNENGEFVNTGGRVLGVTAQGATLEEAHKNAYKAVDLIDWPEGFCRRDIAWRALGNREAAE